MESLFKMLALIIKDGQDEVIFVLVLPTFVHQVLLLIKGRTCTTRALLVVVVGVGET